MLFVALPLQVRLFISLSSFPHDLFPSLRSPRMFIRLSLFRIHTHSLFLSRSLYVSRFFTFLSGAISFLISVSPSSPRESTERFKNLSVADYKNKRLSLLSSCHVLDLRREPECRRAAPRRAAESARFSSISVPTKSGACVFDPC